MRAKLGFSIAACIGGFIFAGIQTSAVAKGSGYRTAKDPSGAAAGFKRSSAQRRSVTRPSNVTAGAKKISTTILPATQVAAIAREKSRRQAMWVAGNANPRAHAGPWHKGNLKHYPNPNLHRTVARPSNVNAGAKRGVCANLTQYALRLGVYQGHGSSYQANLAAVRHFERNGYRRAASATPPSATPPSATAAPPKPVEAVKVTK